MDFLATDGTAAQQSPIKSDQKSAIPGAGTRDPKREPGNWIADLHGLGVGQVEGVHAIDLLRRSLGEVPEHIGEVAILERMWLARLRRDKVLMLAQDPEDLRAGLRSIAAAEPRSLVTVTDMTHGYSIISVGGPGARACLRKATGLDLRERSFPNLSAAQTRVAKVRSTLLRCDLEDDWCCIILVERSLGAYLWDVLVDLAGDDGLRLLDGRNLRENLFLPDAGWTG